MEVIISALIGAVSTLIAVVVNKRLSFKKVSCPLKNHTKRNANVYKVLDYILNNFIADRAYIYEFHNGETYYSGSSQQKFSCSYEVVNEGVSSECNNSQNFRISNFHTMINALISEKFFFVEKISKLNDPICKAHFLKQGTKSFYMLPIATLSEKTIGVLVVDYVKKEHEITENEIKTLKQSALLVGGYLDCR